MATCSSQSRVSMREAVQVHYPAHRQRLHATTRKLSTRSCPRSANCRFPSPMRRNRVPYRRRNSQVRENFKKLQLQLHARGIWVTAMLTASQPQTRPRTSQPAKARSYYSQLLQLHRLTTIRNTRVQDSNTPTKTAKYASSASQTPLVQLQLLHRNQPKPATSSRRSTPNQNLSLNFNRNPTLLQEPSPPMFLIQRPSASLSWSTGWPPPSKTTSLCGFVRIWRVCGGGLRLGGAIYLARCFV